MLEGNDGAFFYVLDTELKILFVDDDPILREFAQVHLAADKTTVECAADGEEGLAKLERFSPDIILADLEMPKLDGFEFLAKLRAIEAHRRTPVIVVTGREDVKAIDRAFEAGATSFVVKPINWRLLSYQIRFVDRAARAERSLAGMQARATGQMARVVSECAKFMRAALEREPSLKTAVHEHAAWLEREVSGPPS